MKFRPLMGGGKMEGAGGLLAVLAVCAAGACDWFGGGPLNPGDASDALDVPDGFDAEQEMQDDDGAPEDDGSQEEEGLCTPTTDCDDGNVCTDDHCDPSMGCVYSYNAAACDDGDPCTAPDACNGRGSCVGTASVCECASGEDCSEYDDGNPCNGSYACGDDGFCAIDPSTVVACDPSGDTDCRKNQCDPGSGDCVLVDLTGSACSDGDPCTGPDACLAGECVGEPIGCECTDDGDCTDTGGCSTGACDTSSHTCRYTPRPSGMACRAPAGPCDAGEACDGEGLECPPDVFLEGEAGQPVCWRCSGSTAGPTALADGTQDGEGTALCNQTCMVCRGAACGAQPEGDDAFGQCAPSYACNGAGACWSNAGSIDPALVGESSGVELVSGTAVLAMVVDTTPRTCNGSGSAGDDGVACNAGAGSEEGTSDATLDECSDYTEGIVGRGYISDIRVTGTAVLPGSFVSVVCSVWCSVYVNFGGWAIAYRGIGDWINLSSGDCTSNSTIENVAAGFNLDAAPGTHYVRCMTSYTGGFGSASTCGEGTGMFWDTDDLSLSVGARASIGTVTSTPVAPLSVGQWQRFFAEADLPGPETTIVYAILDAADDAVLCTIPSVPPGGFDISSCAGSAAAVKLVARLATDDPFVTPVLRNWYVTWI